MLFMLFFNGIQKVISAVEFATCQDLVFSLWPSSSCFPIIFQTGRMLFKSINGYKVISYVAYNHLPSSRRRLIFVLCMQFLFQQGENLVKFLCNQWCRSRKWWTMLKLNLSEHHHCSKTICIKTVASVHGLITWTGYTDKLNSARTALHPLELPCIQWSMLPPSMR
jgi:hypothetical protein